MGKRHGKRLSVSFLAKSLMSYNHSNKSQLTDVPEGTIFRVITWLDETCMVVRDAARVIGGAELLANLYF